MSETRTLDLDLHRDHPTRAKHERLKDHLVNEMIVGRLKPGELLPSEHHLVTALGVARTTIRQAMASLESDGLIRRVQGKGTFVEDDALRKMRRGQDIFALVVPETRGGLYPSLLHGFETAATNVHHQTFICNTNNDVERQANIVLQLLDKEVGGVAIVPTTEPATPAFQIRQIQKRGIPVVFCHRRVDGVDAPLLAIPFRESGYLAGKAIADRGHRRVAMFTSQRSLSTSAYERGLQDGLRAGGCDLPATTVCIGESVFPQEELVFQSLQEVFTGPNRPTAIFATFDSLAEMIYLLLSRLGLSVPGDVSLVGEGGAWRDGAIIRKLTSVTIDEAATGEKAVSLLHEMRSGTRTIDNKQEFVLPLGIYEGETLSEPARASL